MAIDGLRLLLLQLPAEEGDEESNDLLHTLLDNLILQVTPSSRETLHHVIKTNHLNVLLTQPSLHSIVKLNLQEVH